MGFPQTGPTLEDGLFRRRLPPPLIPRTLENDCHDISKAIFPFSSLHGRGLLKFGSLFNCHRSIGGKLARKLLKRKTDTVDGIMNGLA